MTFVEVLQVALPLILYVVAIILLIALIVLVVKIIKTMKKVDEIVDNVESKVKSLDRVFGFIDFCTDKVSYMTNKVVDNVTNLVMHFKKKKYNKKEEEENE